jgi:hypothetical protein
VGVFVGVCARGRVCGRVCGPVSTRACEDGWGERVCTCARAHERAMDGGYLFLREARLVHLHPRVGPPGLLGVHVEEHAGALVVHVRSPRLRQQRAVQVFDEPAGGRRQSERSMRSTRTGARAKHTHETVGKFRRLPCDFALDHDDDSHQCNGDYDNDDDDDNDDGDDDDGSDHDGSDDDDDDNKNNSRNSL